MALSNSSTTPVTCPKCHSDGIERVRRNRLEKLAGKVVPNKAYRCWHCSHRFLVRDS